MGLGMVTVKGFETVAAACSGIADLSVPSFWSSRLGPSGHDDEVGGRLDARADKPGQGRRGTGGDLLGGGRLGRPRQQLGPAAV